MMNITGQLETSYRVYRNLT